MDNDLMFWVNWVQLTKDQRLELISYIDDNSILAEIAIREKSKSDVSVGDYATSRINDNELLLYVASEAYSNDVIIRTMEGLTQANARLLFDMPRILGRFSRDPKFLKSMVECTDYTEEGDGLIDYYSRHQFACVRFQVFNRIIERLEDAINDERDKCFQALQDMTLREPNAEARSAMQQKLDRLTEDHI